MAVVINIIYSNNFSSGLAKDGIAAVFPYLQVDFNLTRSQVGLILTFIFMSSTTVSIISGRVIDNIGAKREMLLSVVKVGIFIVLFSVVHQFWAFLILALY